MMFEAVDEQGNRESTKGCFLNDQERTTACLKRHCTSNTVFMSLKNNEMICGIHVLVTVAAFSSRLLFGTNYEQ